MLTILDLQRQKGLEPKRVSASEWAGPCPGCGGKDRFRSWPEAPDGGNGWCRQCEWGGDTIQFCRDFLGMDFGEACEHVGRDAKVSPTPRQAQAPRGQRAFVAARPDLPPALWQQRAADLVAWAHAKLLRSPEQLAYLAGRGISEATARRFRLGWNPGEKGEDLYRTRESWGLPTLLKDDGKTPRRIWIPRGIVIPVFAPHAGTDSPVRLRIRRPKEHLQPGEATKYVVVSGSSAHTLVTDRAARAFVIVEAEFDAMLISQALGASLPGAVSGVALGSLAFKPDAATDELLTRSLAVLVALDYEPVSPEEDKSKAANLRRVYGWWLDRYKRAERWPVPQGKDPGDAFQAGVDIAAWVTAGLPPVLRIRDAEPATVGPLSSGGVVARGARLDVPGHLASQAAELARHMAAHGITIQRADSGRMVPQRGEATPASAMEEVVFLIPDDLLVWLDKCGAGVVTGETLQHAIGGVR
jgi:hypothetical protein